MKSNSAPNFLETEGLENDQKSFTILQGRRMFEILSSNIYSDKPLALLREYGCNAYDAHIMVGKQDVPFEVHLPNVFEPWMAIRDFGPGLAHDTVLELYTTYGLSTKTNENESIGMLGLGSKSAFAYAKQFTITSRHDGWLRTYQAFVNEEGIPQITLLTEEESDEPAGLEIWVPVQQEDYDVFADRARRVFFRFPTLPIITGNIIELTKVEYKWDGPGYHVRENYTDYYADRKGCFAIQGVVSYPIKTGAFRDKLTPEMERLIDRIPLDIDFNIGELNVAASREALDYDKNTQANIIAKLEMILDDLPKHFIGALDNCKSLWTAKIFYKKWINDQDSFVREIMSITGKGVSWNGIEISDNYIKVNLCDKVTIPPEITPDMDAEAIKLAQPTTVMRPFAEVTGFNDYDLTSNEARYNFNMSSDFKINVSHETIIVLEDMPFKRPIRSIQKLFGHKRPDNLYFIRHGYDINRLDEILERMGNPTKYVLTSDLIEPAADPVPEKPQVKKMYQITGTSYGSYLSTRETNVDVNLGGVYMVQYKSVPVHPLFPDIACEEIAPLMNKMAYFNYLNFKDTTMYVFNSSHRRTAEKKGSKWTSYYDTMTPQLKDIYHNKLLQKCWSFFGQLKILSAERSDTYELNFGEYLRMVEKIEDRSLFSSNKFFQLADDGERYLKLLNAKMGKSYTLREAIDAAPIWFDFMKFIRKIYKYDEYEMLALSPSVLISKKSLMKNYPIINKLVSHISYYASETAVTVTDVRHYINLCDSMPSIVNTYQKERN